MCCLVLILGVVCAACGSGSAERSQVQAGQTSRKNVTPRGETTTKLSTPETAAQNTEDPEQKTANKPIPTASSISKEMSQARVSSQEMYSLQRDLQKIQSSSGVRIAVEVKDLSGTMGGKEVGVDQNERFQSASLIKLLILYELLHEVDEGKISLDEPLGGSTVGALAQSMIEVSDNDAANLLIDRLGFENINAEAKRLSLKQTSLGRHMLDFEAQARGEDNYTSASDTVKLLSGIWNGTDLSPQSREFALYALEHQQLNTKIPAALPPDVRVLHKTGELPGIEHDAGIVITPDGKVFAIAVLTHGNDSEDIAAIHKVAAVSYETFSAP